MTDIFKALLRVNWRYTCFCVTYSITTHPRNNYSSTKWITEEAADPLKRMNWNTWIWAKKWAKSKKLIYVNYMQTLAGLWRPQRASHWLPVIKWYSRNRQLLACRRVRWSNENHISHDLLLTGIKKTPLDFFLKMWSTSCGTCAGFSVWMCSVKAGCVFGIQTVCLCWISGCCRPELHFKSQQAAHSSTMSQFYHRQYWEQSWRLKYCTHAVISEVFLVAFDQ